jgi:hypothetical protein
MSLTSYRAAPPRARVLAVFRRIVSPWIRLVLASCGLAAGVCLAGAVVDPAYSGADRRLGVLRRGCVENGMPRGFKGYGPSPTVSEGRPGFPAWAGSS